MEIIITKQKIFWWHRLLLLIPVIVYAIIFSMPSSPEPMIAIHNHPDAKHGEVIYITYEEGYIQEMLDLSNKNNLK